MERALICWQCELLPSPSWLRDTLHWKALVSILTSSKTRRRLWVNAEMRSPTNDSLSDYIIEFNPNFSSRSFAFFEIFTNSTQSCVLKWRITFNSIVCPKKDTTMTQSWLVLPFLICKTEGKFQERTEGFLDLIAISWKKRFANRWPPTNKRGSVLRNRQTHLFKRGCTIFDCFLSDEICEEGISKKMSGSDVRWREKRIWKV